MTVGDALRYALDGLLTFYPKDPTEREKTKWIKMEDW